MELNKKRRIAFFTTILIICTICIGITISIQMNEYYEKEIQNNEAIGNNELYELDQELFRSKFINSFNNKLNITNSEKENIKKIEEENEIIYTKTIQEKVDNKYQLNINIPYLNIENDEIKTYNEEIEKIFESKIEEIKSRTVSTIYTVDYIANINDNVLSLVIKATLKEGKSSQRLIIKTYNYNLEKNKQIKIEELISKKELKIKDVTSKLRQEIEKQNKEALELKELGYSVFIRNIAEEMFNIENINTFFVDNDGYIYIIYAYGNNNLTTEMDIVVF